MRIDITGRHMTVTPDLEDLITKRLGSLKKVLNDAALRALVVVTKEKYRKKVEISVHTRGDHDLSGTAEANDWVLAVRQAVLKIEQQAKKLKGKWTDRKRQTAKVVRARKTAANDGRERTGLRATVPVPPPSGPRVIRASRYAVKPMSVEDAALQLEDAREDFLVFRDADDDSVAILFRRKDGNLGLIQP